MDKDKLNTIWIVVFFLSLFIVLMILQMPSQPYQLKKHVFEGELYEFENDREYCCELSDFCIKNHYLYLLYGDKGIIKVFNDDGVYEKSYAFYVSKGQSHLFVDDSKVFLFDQRLNCYVIADGVWVDYIPYEDYGSYLDMKNSFASDEEKQFDNGMRYSIQGSSIYRFSSDQTVRVIERPFYYAFFQGVTPFIVIVLNLTLLLILKLLSEKSGKGDGSHLTRHN